MVVKKIVGNFVEPLRNYKWANIAKGQHFAYAFDSDIPEPHFWVTIPVLFFQILLCSSYTCSLSLNHLLPAGESVKLVVKLQLEGL